LRRSDYTHTDEKYDIITRYAHICIGSHIPIFIYTEYSKLTVLSQAYFFNSQLHTISDKYEEREEKKEDRGNKIPLIKFQSYLYGLLFNENID